MRGTQARNSENIRMAIQMGDSQYNKAVTMVITCTLVYLMTVFYDNNVQDCYDKLSEIEIEMDKIFPSTKKYPKRTFKHSNDPTQKSLVTDIEYVFKNGDSVQLACYDYSEEHGSQDHLSVALATKEIYDFYINEAYE